MKLIEAARQYNTATTTFGRLAALHTLRVLLVEDEMGIMLEIDAAMEREEKQLDPAAYEAMRRIGYVFHCDLESARELLSNPEEPYECDGTDEGADGLF